MDIRIPSDATPEIKEAFRQVQTILNRLTGDRNSDWHGRRIINAGDAVQQQDYVTLRQIQQLIAAAATGGGNTTTPGGTQLVPPVIVQGFQAGSVLFISTTGQIAENPPFFRWDNSLHELTVDGVIRETIWAGEIIGVDVGGTGLNGGVSGGVLAFVASGVLQSSAELGAGLVIVGGGAGDVPSTDALLGSDPVAPPDGSAWLVETSPTSFEIRARIGGVTQTLVAAAIVNVDPAGALDGDGSGGSPLAVRVDGVTVTINGSNELEAVAAAAGPHAASHENGGLDEINVGGLSGVLADPQTVDVLAAGALDGDGSAGDPLAVRVDGVTVTINASNNLEVIPAAPGASFYPIKFTVVEAGTPITTGVKRYTRVIIPGEDGNLIQWDLRSDPSATITIDVLKNGVSITDGNEPGLTAAAQDDDNDLSDWDDVAVVEGDVITIEVLANDLSEFFELQLVVERT